MRLSILIPTRNRAQSLKHLLDSLESAVHPDGVEVEILAVDNGSTDGTESLLIEETARSRKFGLTALREPQKGKASALNLGLAAARGDIILVLDDDVVADPQCLVGHLGAYRATSFDAVQGRVLPGTDLDGLPADRNKIREYNIPLIDYGADTREIRGLTGTNMSFKREVFESVGPFDTRLGPGASGFSEDTEYSMRIRKAGFKIGYSPRAVVFHEIDPNRYGKAYNRAVEYRKGISRSLYRRDSIVFRVLPDLVANCLRYGFYNALGMTQKTYKTEGRIMKCWGYLMGKMRGAGDSNPRGTP